MTTGIALRRFGQCGSPVAQAWPIQSAKPGKNPGGWLANKQQMSGATGTASNRAIVSEPYRVKTIVIITKARQTGRINLAALTKLHQGVSEPEAADTGNATCRCVKYGAAQKTAAIAAAWQQRPACRRGCLKATSASGYAREYVAALPWQPPCH